MLISNSTLIAYKCQRINRYDPLSVVKSLRMNAMTEEIRKAVRVALAERDWNKSKLADEAGVSRQFVSEMMRGPKGDLQESWQKIFDALGLELKVGPKK